MVEKLVGERTRLHAHCRYRSGDESRSVHLLHGCDAGRGPVVGDPRCNAVAVRRNREIPGIEREHGIPEVLVQLPSGDHRHEWRFLLLLDHDAEEILKVAERPLHAVGRRFFGSGIETGMPQLFPSEQLPVPDFVEWIPATTHPLPCLELCNCQYREIADREVAL